jgi:hypothetical protein
LIPVCFAILAIICPPPLVVEFRLCLNFKEDRLVFIEIGECWIIPDDLNGTIVRATVLQQQQQEENSS